MSQERPGVSGKSRMARVLGRALRAPAILERKGTRWLFQAISPPAKIVLVNRGRKSGRLYKTPVLIVDQNPGQGEIVVAPMWGKHTDWYRNVIAGGLVEIHVRGDKRQVEWRELDEAERSPALEAFRGSHPIYGRMLLRALARLNRLEGDPLTWTAGDLPMLGLRELGE
jgi:deazaflavin-dependent oxidoreductase (nitroreductase family)